jgi:hypothetical protein
MLAGETIEGVDTNETVDKLEGAEDWFEDSDDEDEVRVGEIGEAVGALYLGFSATSLPLAVAKDPLTEEDLVLFGGSR